MQFLLNSQQERSYGCQWTLYLVTIWSEESNQVKLVDSNRNSRIYEEISKHVKFDKPSSWPPPTTFPLFFNKAIWSLKGLE